MPIRLGSPTIPATPANAPNKGEAVIAAVIAIVPVDTHTGMSMPYNFNLSFL